MPDVHVGIGNKVCRESLLARHSCVTQAVSCIHKPIVPSVDSLYEENSLTVHFSQHLYCPQNGLGWTTACTSYLKNEKKNYKKGVYHYIDTKVYIKKFNLNFFFEKKRKRYMVRNLNDWASNMLSQATIWTPTSLQYANLECSRTATVAFKKLWRIYKTFWRITIRIVLNVCWF
jgi:hypothetical protein